MKQQTEKKEKTRSELSDRNTQAHEGLARSGDPSSIPAPSKENSKKTGLSRGNPGDSSLEGVADSNKMEDEDEDNEKDENEKPGNTASGI